MPYSCFSYSVDLPPSVTSHGAAQRAPRGSESMPGYPCFAYTNDIPQAVSGPRRMPLPCFSYPADVPQGVGSRGGVQPTSPELRSMPYPCFRY
jgi:hypothetical protein